MTTTVRNLATGEEHTYTLPPEKAVVCAWYQEKNNWNTWDYDYENAPIIEGRRTVACGDWCARRKTTPTGLVIPKGYRHVAWQEVEAGQEVYLAGTMYNQPHAYGPFTVYRVMERKLLSPQSKTRFMHYREDLLIKKETA